LGGSDSRPTLYHDVRALLSGLGLPFAESVLVTSADSAVEAATTLGMPVVMKANVPSTVHKAELGGVRIGLGDEAAIRAAFDALDATAAAAGGGGVVVEPNAFGSLQVIVGARLDPAFGPVIVLGSGGAAAEYLKDSAVALGVPGDETAMRELVGETGIGRFMLERYPLLAGELVGVLTTLARWFANGGALAVDVNPVLIDTAAGSLACVDARVEWGS
jgi:succinyl-CoA synthetase beta subunit